MGENTEKEIFINRELSWLGFNKRVLFEAFDDYNPLFERLKFMSIYFSNLDEFFMVRVGSLKEDADNLQEKTDDKTGWSVERQLEEIYKSIKRMEDVIEEGYKNIVAELKKKNIDIIDFENITEKEKEVLEKYFDEEVFPEMSYQIVDSEQPFPYFKNKEIYITAILKAKNGDEKTGIISTAIEDLYYTFCDGETKKAAFISDMTQFFAHKFFTSYNIKEIYKIRVTRNADISVSEAILDSDSDIDFRGIVKNMLKKRRIQAPVRVQACGEPSDKMKEFLCKKLDCESNIIFTEKLPLNFSFGFSLYKALKLNDENMLFKANKPAKCVKSEKGKLMKYIKKNDLLISVPFQSFKTFVDLIYEAADNEDVVSIKISLYRLADHSKVVSALAYAAEGGKEVVCLLELRARFDEQSNIDYSKVLEDAGCKVVYGLSDYKVHAKMCLITKRHHKKVSYITQIGTGNYNEKTSEQYTDISYITADKGIGADAAALFDALCRGEFVENAKSLWIAPDCYKTNVIKLIDEEISRHKAEGNGFIAVKVNSMNDTDIMRKFIEASQAGVKIELYIRGICCMRSGVKGYTENITVKSIVGKYLEHSRILCFGRNGNEKIFIGSGDFLNRNTRRRIEVYSPVKAQGAKETILKILEFCRKDNKKGWYMKPDGSYYKKELSQGDIIFDSQHELEKYFKEKEEEFHKKK